MDFNLLGNALSNLQQASENKELPAISQATDLGKNTLSNMSYAPFAALIPAAIGSAMIGRNIGPLYKKELGSRLLGLAGAAGLGAAGIGAIYGLASRNKINNNASSLLYSMVPSTTLGALAGANIARWTSSPYWKGNSWSGRRQLLGGLIGAGVGALAGTGFIPGLNDKLYNRFS